MSDDARATVDPTWDETTRPTVVGADEPSYSEGQTTAHDHLVQIHDHLRSELGRLQGLVGEVRRGLLSVGGARAGVAAMTIRQNNWTLGAYCQSYCGFVNGHHTLEDASVFPHLRSREPALASVVDRLHEEHQVIHHLLDQVDRALVALVSSGDSAELDALDAQISLLSDRLLSHLAYEERELRGPLARHGFF